MSDLDYENKIRGYSLDTLKEILKSINRTKYPERFKIIKTEIALRERNAMDAFANWEWNPSNGKVGLDILMELKKQGLLGCFFDYHGYQELKRIKKPIELATFLPKYGFKPNLQFNDSKSLVYDLVQQNGAPPSKMVEFLDPNLITLILDVVFK